MARQRGRMCSLGLLLAALLLLAEGPRGAEAIVFKTWANYELAFTEALEMFDMVSSGMYVMDCLARARNPSENIAEFSGEAHVLFVVSMIFYAIANYVATVRIDIEAKGSDYEVVLAGFCCCQLLIPIILVLAVGLNLAYDTQWYLTAVIVLLIYIMMLVFNAGRCVSGDTTEKDQEAALMIELPLVGTFMAFFLEAQAALELESQLTYHKWLMRFAMDIPELTLSCVDLAIYWRVLDNSSKYFTFMNLAGSVALVIYHVLAVSLKFLWKRAKETAEAYNQRIG